MQHVIGLLEQAFSSFPLPLMELWGRFAYLIGLLLALLCFGRITLRPGGRWGLGLERQIWNARAFFAAGFSFVALLVSGWLGSSIVLVEGAQTFESLKDVVFFACVLLFGFPALLALPPAYMASDLIEGIPPAWVLGWTLGYFLLSAYAWIGYQLIGRDPDFRRLRNWALYLPFVGLLLLCDPVMWGYICSDKFGTAISFRVISPAVVFTKTISWIVLPFFMMAALPLARRMGLFWADIPGHVKQRRLGSRTWTWETGHAQAPPQDATASLAGSRELPLRIVLAGSFIGLTLFVACAVALIATGSGEEAANKLAGRLHQEISANIDEQLNDYLDGASGLADSERLAGMSRMLAGLPIAKTGRALVFDPHGRLLASSSPEHLDDPVGAAALRSLREHVPEPAKLQQPREFRFDVLIAKPLSRETWLAGVSPYTSPGSSLSGMTLVALPESYYLADLREGSSRTALLCAIAICLAMLLAGLLAALVAAPTRRITAAAEAMAAGNLDQQVARSRLAEMDALVRAFNRMAAQLQDSFGRAAASENTLKSIFAASPIALAVLRTESTTGERSMMDPERGRIVLDCNEAWERTTGHRCEDIVGRSSTALNLWARHEDRMRFVQQLYEQGSVDDFEARMLRADGTEYDGLIAARDVLVGKDRLAVFAVDDVSEKKRAAAEVLALNQRLKALLDAAVEVAIIATDLDCNITFFNTGAEKMLGYTEDEVRGRSALHMHLPADIEACVAAFAILEDDGVFRPEQIYNALTRDGSSTIRNWIFVRKNGETLQVSMALSAVRGLDGEPQGYLGMARDITEQLAAQEEMVELNMTLDQRVRERTQAMQESKEQLQQALDNLRRMQSQLVQSEKLSGLAHIVAGVAHELNTPIGNSLTVASTLFESSKDVQREMGEGALRKQRLNDYLGAMVDGTALLERALRQAATLVSNFKRVAVDQGGSVLRQFDLLATVNDIVILLQPAIKKTPYKVEIDVPEGLLMESYPGALEQVITNLINNAMVHAFAGREHGTMKLKARLEDDDSGRVRIEFSDDGVGMSDSTLAQIFNPFFTTALGKGGSGLGMSITYSLITGTLGGEISANSVPGLGSQFLIRLPLKASARAAEAAALEQ